MALLNPLFIHGWAFSSKAFTLPGIKGIDLPAHGLNREPYVGMEETAKAVARGMWDRHDLIGWSLGASVALLVALRFPKKVRRLYLIGASPFFGGAWGQKNLRAFKVRVRREGVSWFRSLAYPKEFRDDILLEDASRMLEDYMELDLRRRLPLLRCETFIVHGERDPITPVRESFKLHSLIRGSKLILLPGGHFPAKDEKSLLSAILKVS